MSDLTTFHPHKEEDEGYLAAEAVLRSSGAPQEFLQEDLAPDGLMKFWARAAIRNR